MSAFKTDISSSSESWRAVDYAGQAQVAYDPYSLWSVDDDAFKSSAPINSTPPAHGERSQGNIFDTFSGQAACVSITVTMVQRIGEISQQSNVLDSYLSEIDSLPVVKRAELFKALNKIDARLLDLDFSDDGQIVIRTQENGCDCFYAICTEEGDFKGTWLSDGSLKRRSWSANLPYDYLVMGLI